MPRRSRVDRRSISHPFVIARAVRLVAISYETTGDPHVASLLGMTLSVPLPTDPIRTHVPHNSPCTPWDDEQNKCSNRRFITRLKYIITKKKATHVSHLETMRSTGHIKIFINQYIILTVKGGSSTFRENVVEERRGIKWILQKDHFFNIPLKEPSRHFQRRGLISFTDAKVYVWSSTAKFLAKKDFAEWFLLYWKSVSYKLNFYYFFATLIISKLQRRMV